MHWKITLGGILRRKGPLRAVLPRAGVVNLGTPCKGIRWAKRRSTPGVSRCWSLPPTPALPPLPVPTTVASRDRASPDAQIVGVCEGVASPALESPRFSNSAFADTNVAWALSC